MAGNDILYGRAGNDSLNGGADNDTVLGEDGDDILEGGLGLDILYGGNGNDTIHGGEGVDRFYGEAGNDTLEGGLGNDTMSGGTGDDTYIVSTGDNVVESVNAGTDTILSNISYTLGINVENLSLTDTVAINAIGNALNNILTGNNAVNNLSGAVGNDILDGLAGADTLTGGIGNDILAGGVGADNFVFDTLPNSTNNVDIISDFNKADDTLVLKNTIFNSFTITGTIAVGNFIVGSTAQDSDDFLIYDSTDGSLYYDADGNGAGTQIEIVSLTGTPVLTAANLLII